MSVPTDWIKLRDDLHEDPRVFQMAELLSKTAQSYVLVPTSDLLGPVTNSVTRYALRDVTVAGLSRVWRAANRHTTDGVFHHATLDYLDTLAQVPGFGRAMAAVAYAVFDPATTTVTLPRFTEYNSPNKNGERAKSKAAERQKKYRDSLKSKTAPESPSPASESPETVTPPHNESKNSDVTSDVTPSYSNSISNTEGTSSGTTPGIQSARTLADLQTRINALRPAWVKTPRWSSEEEAALFESLPNVQALEDKDWHLLAFYFRWANSTANQGRESHRVTSKRHIFVRELGSYLDRATTHWKQSNCPKLTPAERSEPSVALAKEEPAGPTVWSSLVKDLGLKPASAPPPNASTKPAAVA